MNLCLQALPPRRYWHKTADSL